MNDGVETIVGIHVNTAFGHEGVDDANADFFTEFAQLFASTSADATVAGQYHRPFSLTDQIKGKVNNFVVSHRPAHAAAFQCRFNGLMFGDIFRQFQVHGTGLFQAGDTNGLAYRFRNGVGMNDGVRPFGHGFEHFHHIHHLVGLLVKTCCITLPG